MADEFGITLDSSGVPWRHALLESDEEENENSSPESFFHFDGGFEGKKLATAPMFVCVGRLASDFAVSHLLQRDAAPSYTLCTSSTAAVYPRYSGAPEKGEGEKGEQDMWYVGVEPTAFPMSLPSFISKHYIASVALTRLYVSPVRPPTPEQRLVSPQQWLVERAEPEVDGNIPSLNEVRVALFTQESSARNMFESQSAGKGGVKRTLSAKSMTAQSESGIMPLPRPAAVVVYEFAHIHTEFLDDVRHRRRNSLPDTHVLDVAVPSKEESEWRV